MFLVDDLGWSNLGCYGGNEYETPNFDRMAREGMRFTNAYANCPVCSPSRVALMTGKYPSRLQYTGHITAIEAHRHPENSRILPPDDNIDLPLDEITLAESLAPAGYTSASVGKWHIGREGYFPKDQGFDENVAGNTHGAPPSYFWPYVKPDSGHNPRLVNLDPGPNEQYLTDRLTDESIEFIRENKDDPFFLYATYYAVHTPLEAPPELVAKYEQKFAGREVDIKPTYAAMVENLDRNLGRLLTSLEMAGVADNTAIILTSDNGCTLKAAHNRPLREGKGWLYEGGIRVPLIVHWPGQVPAGITSDEPVMGCDLFPTIRSIAGDGTTTGAPIDGLDLSPLWQGETTLNRESLYWYHPHYVQQPGAAIRQGDYKLIEFYDPPRLELYNISKDIGETTNLADVMPEKTREMRAAIRQHLKDVDAKMHTANPDRVEG
jgi:arylsulfatase A-like enzyme